MGHLSIAIIKKSSSLSTPKDPRFDYLIIKTTSVNFKFFDRESMAIGGRFDYSGFKNQIVQYFELPSEYASTPESTERVDFSNIQPFKTNKREPYATAYEYLLSDIQVEHIQKQLENNQGIWKNHVWISEAQLLKKRAKWEKSQEFIFERETAFRQPKFSNELRTSLKNIVRAKENGKLVIFAGAGVSFDSNVPGWSQLIDELKGDLDKDESEYLTIGQLYYDSRGKKEYIDKIQEVLKHGKTRFNSIHEKIVELNPLHIITTNYDTHFEQVLDKRSYRYSIVRKDSDLPYSKGASLFIKMHGDFDEKNIVLKKDDYGEGYATNFPLVEGFVKGVFASKLVLFVGFSFTDPNLNQILLSVQNILQDDNQPPYLLMIPPEKMSRKKRNEYKENITRIEAEKVKVVDYEETSINDYFEQVISEEDRVRINELTVTGQKVYKFMKVIEQFDNFSDSLDSLHTDKQLTNSILRFKGLGAIPPSVLESITPFRLKKKSNTELSTNAYYDPHTPFHLETLNENLLSFLKKKLKNGKLEFPSYQDKSLPFYEQELNKALQILYSSGVRCIVRKNDTSPLHLKLKPINQKEKCNCHRCLVNRFEFDHLLQSLTTLSTKLICKNAQQDIGLIEAYGFQKTGQFARAFYVLEELKTKAWKNQEYITYFLALYNQTLLNPFMSIMNDTSFGTEELENISDKIKQIDLNQTVFELPVDSSIKEALIIIKENKQYHSTRSLIESENEKVLENYEKYKTGGYRSMGPPYWHKVETSFFNLWQFYHNNLLFNDEYSYFINLGQLYIESMIASFQTSSDYEQRMNHFSPFFTLIFINYGRSKALKSLLDKYSIEHFEFEDQRKTIKDILESFETFCNCSFEKNSFFNNDIYKNPLYSTATSNSSFFESKVKSTFNNFLLLLGKLNLSKKEVNNVVGQALNYLTTSPIFKAHTSLQYFTGFVTHFIKKIDENNTERLLEYILSDNIWSDDLIEPVCSAIINQQKKEGFLGEDFYKKMIRRTEAKRKWSVPLKAMIPFYCLLNQPQRKSFKKDISSLLEDSESIKKAYYWGIWTPDDDRIILGNFVTNLLTSCKDFPDFEIRPNGLPDRINSFSVWNDLHFIVDLIYVNDFFAENFVKELHDNVKSKMFKWILRPNDFDYSEFNTRWILAFRVKHITAVLKRIDLVKDSISKGLQDNYDESIAEIYFERLMK